MVATPRVHTLYAEMTPEGFLAFVSPAGEGAYGRGCAAGDRERGGGDEPWQGDAAAEHRHAEQGVQGPVRLRRFCTGRGC